MNLCWVDNHTSVYGGCWLVMFCLTGISASSMKDIEILPHDRAGHTEYRTTSRSAVAKRPCDASCLSVVSFNNSKS